jgi:hypothetical protein
MEVNTIEGTLQIPASLGNGYSDAQRLMSRGK